MRIGCVKPATRVVRSLMVDDKGQDLVEYALLAGLVAVSCVLVFPMVNHMATAYGAWISNAQSIWEAPPPL